MKKLTLLLMFSICWLTAMLPGCQKDDLTDPVVDPDLPFLGNPNDTLDPNDPVDQVIIDLIDSTFQFGNIIQQPDEIEEPQLVSEENTVQDTLVCSIKKYKWAPGYMEPLLFDPTSDVMWVGALLRAESITDGSYTPIAAYRKPLVISTSLQNINGSPTDTIYFPSLSSFRESVNQMLNQGVNGATAANVTSKIEEVRASEEFKLSIGANYGGFWGKVKSSFNWNTQQEKSRFAVVFQQIYYSVDLDIPNSPSDFFLTPPDLTQFGEYSPVYVSSIKYGRMALFTFESEKNSEELGGSLDVAFNAFGGSGEIDIDAMHKENINSSSIKAYIVGGSGAYAVQAIQGFEGLKQWIVEGGNYSSDSPGVPMAYQLRFLKDNSLAKIVLASEYSVRTCEIKYEEKTLGPTSIASVYDGCPILTFGDNEFDNPAVKITGSIKLAISDDRKRVMATIDIDYNEPAPDNHPKDTRARLYDEIVAYELDDDNKTIVSILSDTETTIDYTPNSNGNHHPPFAGDFISDIILQADGDGDDLPCVGYTEDPDGRAFVRILFKDILVNVK